MQQDDDNQNLVLGILFGIIALVIGLVIGLGVYVTGQNRAPAPVAAVVAEEPEIAEVGEALVKFYFESGKAELPAGAEDEHRPLGDARVAGRAEARGCGHGQRRRARAAGAHPDPDRRGRDGAAEEARLLTPGVHCQLRT